MASIKSIHNHENNEKWRSNWVRSLFMTKTSETGKNNYNLERSKLSVVSGTNVRCVYMSKLGKISLHD